MSHLVAQLCANAVTADAPDIVHLMPLGEINGRDGRKWTVSNAQAIVNAFVARGVDLPIDFEHQSETNAENRTGPVPAAGWIKELQTRPDGIWGRVEWTAQARELIALKAYRYLSPVMVHRQGETEVLRLKGAGLVHHPNLTLTALASEENDMNKNAPGNDTAQPPSNLPILQLIRTMLGLPETASDDEIAKTLESALSALPDLEKYVPIAAMQSVMDDRFERVSVQSEQRAEAKVSDAISKGYITPAMKGWATALCAQNEASFDAFVAKSPAAFGHLTTTSHTQATPPSHARSLSVERQGSAVSICRQLGLEETALD